MGRSRSNRRKNGIATTLQEKGIGLCALGLGMLILPALLGSSPITKAFAAGLRVPGWLTLVIGVVMLGIHQLVKQNAVRAEPTPRGKVPSSSIADKQVLQEVWSEITKSPRDATVATPLVRQLETRWSPAVFAAIEWRRFEAVCERLFGQGGLETRSQSHGADGGVDIWLHSRNAEGPVAVVQCKHWQGKAVGVRQLREFLGVMTAHKVGRGTYATSSTYTADARKFAKDNGINALDGEGLLALIAQRTPEQQQALLDVAYEGEYWRPTCASCGIKMVERTPSKGGAAFWGCSNYPRCKTTL